MSTLGQILLVLSVPLLLSDLLWVIGAAVSLIGVGLFDSPVWLIPLSGGLWRALQHRPPTGVRDRLRCALALVWVLVVCAALYLPTGWSAL
jgi:hypothetical protein